MKFKKQIFALGAVAIIATPIATVVSCGSTNESKPKVNGEHFASKPTIEGRVITIGTLVTYSKAAPKDNDTYKFKNADTNITTVYTVIGTPTTTKMTLTVVVGGVKKKDQDAIIGKIDQSAAANGIVLSDSRGVHYSSSPTAANDTLVKTWVNYNTGILNGTSDKSTAFKNINSALAGTFIYVTSVTVGKGKVSTLVLTSKTPTAKVITSGNGLSMSLDGHMVYSKRSPIPTDEYTFNDDSTGTNIATVYKFVSGLPAALIYYKQVGSAAGTTLPAVVGTTVTSGMVLNGNHAYSSSGGIYVADPTKDSSMVTTWLNNNNILARTTYTTAAVKAINGGVFNGTPFVCTSITFASNGTIKSIVITK